MKTSLTIILLTLTLLHAPTAIAAENPPTNAADLYRKAIKLYQPNNDETYAIDQLLSGEKEDYPAIEKHIKANRKALDIALEASNMKKCDWDFILPAYGPADPNEFMNAFGSYLDDRRAMQNIVGLMLADAKVYAHRSDIKKAIDRIMTSYTVSRHIDSNYAMGWLATISVQDRTDHLLIWMLSEKRIDVSMLNCIGMGLKQHIKARKPLMNTFEHEMQHKYKSLEKMNLEFIREMFPNQLRHVFDDPNIVGEIFEDKNAEYNVFDRDYFQAYKQRLRKAIGLSYSQAIVAFEKIGDELSADVAKFGLPDYKTSQRYTAFIIKIVATPPWMWSQQYQLEMRKKTRTNALLAAIKIYTIKARTGKLSDQIPLRSPKDLFSGKDFTYKKTADGFILRSQGKNPYKKDEFFKWEFKTAK